MKKSIFSRMLPLIAAFFMCGTLFAAETPLSLFNKGLDMQSKDDYYSAIEFYRESLEQNPRYGDAWYNLAWCSYCLGEYDLAVEYADNAILYSRDFTRIRNLKGLSLVSLGRLDEARAVFESILSELPNDVEARFGLAQLDLLDGSLSKAQSRYVDALKRDGRNRKALLSLALISAEIGKEDVAERYISQALEYHSGEEEVHYLAAYLSARKGDYEMAEKYCRGSVQINTDYDKGYELLSEILYAQGRYKEVIDLCDFRTGRNRNLSVAWYLRGLSLEALGLEDQALDAFLTGLSIDPYDEIIRLAMEQIVERSVPLEDSRRSQWAEYHVQKADEYKKNYRGSAERYEYQKALTVDPLNPKARRSFAKLLERDELYEIYLDQLKFIQDNQIETQKADIQKTSDTVEALESLMSNNLATKWNVEPFYLDKARWNIGIYYVKNPVQLLHADSEEITAIAAGNIFAGVPVAVVDVCTEPVKTYSDAYRHARNNGRDYFIILDTKETERSFEITAQVYSARTGTKTHSINVYRTGNDRVASCLLKFRQSVLDILPVRGTILRQSQNTLLADLGKSDGVTAGSIFDVVKKGSVYTNDTGPGVSYAKKNIVGQFKVSAVNEEISEGEFEKAGFYDTLNAGDEIILVKLGGYEENTGNLQTDTRPGANKNGEKAVSEKDSSIRNSLKEDLKAHIKESPLYAMIKDIL